MITALIVNDFAEIHIFHYDTNSEEEAVRLLGEDWASGNVKFEVGDEPGAFGPEWVRDSIEHELNDLIPQYENGVRTMHFYCAIGPHERDDRQAWVYFVHSNHKKVQQKDE